jgi:16S rRNA processing protein RimM
MDYNDLFCLGRIIRTFGSKGEVVFYLDVDDPQNYLEMESVFIKLNENLVPFSIDSIQLRPKKQAVVRLHDVTVTDDAELFVGSLLFLPLSFLPPLTGNKFYYHEVKGFAVIDKEKGPIGVIEDVLDLQHQAIMQIRHGDKEILVPISDAIIQKVDRINRQIEIEAPEGLIDIYL